MCVYIYIYIHTHIHIYNAIEKPDLRQMGLIKTYHMPS